MEFGDWLRSPSLPFTRTCPVPRDAGALEALSERGDEIPARDVGIEPAAIERIWDAAVAFYRTGLHPAIQLCIRHRGAVVLHRAVGLARGGGPGDPPDGGHERVTLQTPFLLYSASKAVAAMVIHKLDEQRLVHLDDRVCEYIPEFGKHRKHWITLRHLLAHSAGIPNLPPSAMDLSLLADPDEIAALLCELEPAWGAGRRLGYHAISGGFVLGEVVRRVTGGDMREVQRKEICEPLGLRWMNFGVQPRDVDRVARDAVTGPPVLPPVSWMLRRALGMSIDEVVRKARDPRFLTGVVPAANAISNAEELCRFYQCLLHDGELDGVRVFEPRSVHHATSEQNYREIDLTLGLPLRYGLGMMLGGRRVGLFGLRTPRAFGHLGFTNVFGWADPDRKLSVGLMTSGKPVVSPEMLKLLMLVHEIGRAFPFERSGPDYS